MRHVRQLIPILLLTFINTLGFAIFIPVFPFIAEQYGSGDIMYGLLLSSYAVFQFVGAPLLGTLSDKYGRRPLLLLSHGGTLVGWIIFGIAYFLPDIKILSVALPLWIIMLSRITDGITGGNVAVAHAYLADITHSSERTKAFGLMGAALGIGLIIGPAVGGLSSATSFGYLGTVAIAFLISAVTMILMFLYLPESLKEEHRVKTIEKSIHKHLNIFKKMANFSHIPLLKRLFVINAFFSFVFSAYTTIIVLYAKDLYELTPEILGILFAVTGCFAIFNQGYVAQKLANAWGDKNTLTIGLMIMAIGLLLLLLHPGLLMFLLVSFFTSIGFSSCMPTIKSLFTNHVGPHEQGEITGIDQGIRSAGMATAPIIASILYAHFSALTFAILAALLVIPYLIFWIFRFERA